MSILTPEDFALLDSLSDSEILPLLAGLPKEEQERLLLNWASQAPTAAPTLTKTPHPRQAEFLALECEEALYGGAAGGGKTEALLMWLAEGVPYKDYSGVFFRRTYAEMKGSTDSPIWRSVDMYKPLGGNFNSTDKIWTFPAGSMISFKHMDHEQAVTEYQGSAFHRLAWDELTHFTETQYEYLWSRWRQKQDFAGFPLTIGFRAASNPGGVGHEWVKRRFISDESMRAVNAIDSREPSPAGMVFYKDGRAFVPARVADNPSLDVEHYISNLERHLTNPVLRERLLNGDWSIQEDAIIRADWLHYYDMRGQHLIPQNKKGETIGTIDERELQRFATVDTAGTSKQKADEKLRGKPHSYSVCQVWDYWPKTGFLFLRYCWRERVEFIDLCDNLRRIYHEWDVPRMLIENAALGPGAQSLLSSQGLSGVEMVNPVTQSMKGQSGLPGKVERAAPLLNKMSKGEVFLPLHNNDWLPDLEAEWLAWTGLVDQTDDQIDAASYAANHVGSAASHRTVIDHAFWRTPRPSLRGGSVTGYLKR